MMRKLRGLYLVATHNGETGEFIAGVVVLILAFAVGIASWVALG